MEMLTATYRIVTPMFIGDGLQQATSIRPPSVKGALRFWWRALNWGWIRTQWSCDELALRALHQEEARLFGSAADEKKLKSGQGIFLLHVKQNDRPKTWSPDEANSNLGVKYMLGQGLDKRKALQAGQDFQLIVTFKSATKHDSEQRNKDIANLADTLLLFGLLGGLGSRSRRGLGSIAIQTLEGYKVPYKIPPVGLESYEQLLRKLLGKVDGGIPPFTAFSSAVRIIAEQPTKTDSLSVLDTVGKNMNSYRGYYSKEPGAPHFKSDHDLILDVTSNRKINDHPKRVIFGLPHNYFYKSVFKSAGKEKASVKIDVSIPGQIQSHESGRRASPLFIHIHRFPDDTHMAVQSVIPAHFLPNGSTIRIMSGEKSYQKSQVAVHEDWTILDDYLVRFTSAKRIL